MPLEQEITGLLIGGFSIIVGLMFIITVLLWRRNRNNSAAYASVLLHFTLLSTALYFFIQAVSFNYSHPMASEEISLQIGIAGVIWAMSMFCLLIGLVKFSNRKSSLSK